MQEQGTEIEPIQVMVGDAFDAKKVAMYRKQQASRFRGATGATQLTHPLVHKNRRIMSELMGWPIREMRIHAGVILQGIAVTSLHHAKHQADMFITAMGPFVHLKATSGRPESRLVISWNNIHFAVLMDQAEFPKEPEAEVEADATEA